ncbi:MAG: sulfotransferase, partial [Candidatus Latescibacterota bacterium]
RLLLESVTTRLRSIGAEVHTRPVFILGNQKSGTSPVAGLLSKLTGLPLTMDIRREIEAPEVERICRGELTLEAFIARNKLDFSRPLVKEPNLTFIYNQLVDAFPDSPIVFVYRDPRDNIRSILNRVGAVGSQDEFTEAQLSHMTVGWRRIFAGEPIGKKGDHFVETLAYRWSAAAQILVDNEPRVCPVRFEDFLHDKSGAITRLAGTLGLPASHDIAEHVDHPFQPPGDRSVSWLDFFGPENLSRVERICGAGMDQLGYARSEN